MAKVRPDLTGSRHHFAKLTEEIVEDARIWYYDDPVKITVAELAEHYGVNEATMSKALRGESWKHVKQAKGAQGRTKHVS
jgi:hypothetical protein